MQVAARVGFRVWPRNVAQAERSAPVGCRGGFANPLAIFFVVACGVLRREGIAELVNYIPYLLCDPLQRNHDAQHRLDRRKLRANVLSRFQLAVTFHRRSPFFKTAKPLKNMSTAHGILSESHFNNIVCFSASFS